MQYHVKFDVTVTTEHVLILKQQDRSISNEATFMTVGEYQRHRNGCTRFRFRKRSWFGIDRTLTYIT